MREIKFRCWDKTARKMRQVIEIVFNAGMYYDPNDNTVKLIWVKGHDIINNKDIALEREHKNEYILMQYTGLKDKNGKEIYEGDVLQDKDCIYKVIFEYGSFDGKIIEVLRNVGTQKGMTYQLSFIISDNDNIKVIGNVWEDSDLLNDSKNTKSN